MKTTDENLAGLYRLASHIPALRKLDLIVLIFLAIPGVLTAQENVVRQITDLMRQGPSGKAHQRFVHAKGIVCEGAFEASPDARNVSRAAHFSTDSTPITVRFSDGGPDIAVSDNSPDAAPRGMAIRFLTGSGTDIMAISHNGFVVGTGEEFLALLRAKAATDPSKPHPWPIEQFLKEHPRAAKFVQDPAPMPASFVTEAYHANNAFIFVDSEGHKRAGRYHIIPVNGAEHLDDGTSGTKPPNYLREELQLRLSKAPAKFRLLLQLAQPGDPTDNGSTVWPDDREQVELGILTIMSIVSDSAAAERDLAFNPTRLIDGIELSDDPLPLPGVRLLGGRAPWEVKRKHGVWSRLVRSWFCWFSSRVPNSSIHPIIADFDSPPEVRRILRRPCYDCHFNETRLAWFDRIVPVYWIVARDGGAARKHLDFY